MAQLVLTVFSQAIFPDGRAAWTQTGREHQTLSGPFASVFQHCPTNYLYLSRYGNVWKPVSSNPLLKIIPPLRDSLSG